MKKWCITAAISIILGGYWHGFIYAPQRYDSIFVGDLGSVLIGSFLGYMGWLVCTIFYLAWKETT